ncbi:MAG: hypothetical protein IJO31_08990 [Oscillospiraceae bacterium]|nr:hypothetical protein [Oscillospiraceae bacterium]
MNDYAIKLDVEPKDKYQKAWKALVEAEIAFSDLEPQEQHRLAENYFKVKGMYSLFNALQHYSK